HQRTRAAPFLNNGITHQKKPAKNNQHGVSTHRRQPRRTHPAQHTGHPLPVQAKANPYHIRKKQHSPRHNRQKVITPFAGRHREKRKHRNKDNHAKRLPRLQSRSAAHPAALPQQGNRKREHQRPRQQTRNNLVKIIMPRLFMIKRIHKPLHVMLQQNGIQRRRSISVIHQHAPQRKRPQRQHTTRKRPQTHQLVPAATRAILHRRKHHTHHARKHRRHRTLG